MKGLFSMAKGHTIDPKIKSEVVAKIRDEGMTVVEASNKYGIGRSAIYTWLNDGVVNTSTSLVLEVNRLKKENEQLYNLLGRATVEMKKLKK
jgi:transposase-like protein